MKVTWKVFQLCRLSSAVYPDVELEDLILNPSSATYLLCRLGQVFILSDSHLSTTKCRELNVSLLEEHEAVCLAHVRHSGEVGCI